MASHPTQAAESGTVEGGLIAELNDLLKLDHDAVQAYALAIKTVRDERHAETLRRFRGDHERHIEELTRLIRHHGGTPIELPHLPSGAFKLAVQAVGAAGGTAGVLLAFKANERQVRDKYRGAAERAGHPPDVAAVLSRNAGDEEMHYLWALETLVELGYGPDTRLGKIEHAFEVRHAAAADAVERVERRTLRAAGGARQRVTRQVDAHPLGTALLALGAGFLASQITSRGRYASPREQ